MHTQMSMTYAQKLLSPKRCARKLELGWKSISAHCELCL